MRSIRSILAYWFNKRFVRFIEIVGYLVVIVIALALLYSCLVHVEIKAQVRGTLHPLHVGVTCDKEGLLVSYSVSSGSVVDKGEEVCRVVTDPARVVRARAHVELNEVIESLQTASQEDLIRAREALEKMRDQVFYPPTTESLIAPVAGRVQLIDTVNPGTLFNAGAPLANILRLDRLVMDGTVLPNQTGKIDIGQEARVTLDMDGSVTLKGHLAGKTEEANGVSLEFVDVPSALIRYLESLPQHRQSIPFRNAEIVIGEESLFLYLFARKQ